MRLELLLRVFRLSESTKTCIREARRTTGFSLLDALHGYIYARWPYLYISVGTGEHRLVRLIRPLVNLIFNLLSRLPADHPTIDRAGLQPGNNLRRCFTRRETFVDTYHGKVIRLDAAKKLVSVKKEIHLSNLKPVIPYAVARDLILQNPDRLAVMDCPCRVSRSNPCLPLDVCLIVGEPFVSFTLEHHPHRTRLISSEEAIDILEAEAKRGHVHHAFFKEAVLGRFFAICNCCSCCCGAMQIQRNGLPMLASSGYVSVVDTSACLGCETCVTVCEFHAISVIDGLARVDPAACMGCGVCETFCPQEALFLARDPSRSDPLELDELIGDSNKQSGVRPISNYNYPKTI